MKTLLRLPLVALAASLLFIGATAQAQNAPTPRYKDMVAENPTAEADMKVIGDYVNALVAGETDKAKGMLAPGYIGHGPARLDSANAEQTITRWQANYKTQLNRKVGFITQTFKVLSGNLKGNWVSMWGDYTFTDAATSKTVTFPFQYTASVANGKVTGDRIYYDVMSILTQVGYKVTPPEVAKK
jgi:hypothetical protein